MSSIHLRFIALAMTSALAVTSCTDSTSSSSTSTSSKSGPTKIAITLSDEGCEPHEIAATAGPATFTVANNGSAAVTEFEILSAGKIIGEVENVTPGADRSFSLTLKEGSYVTYCPNGKREKGTLEVARAGSGASGNADARKKAVAAYLASVSTEADALVAATAPFVDAVKAGNVEQAKSLFAAARFHYETIEPIAESFGGLDPAIDARDGDVAAGTTWGGFHRIEKALWTDTSTAGMGPIADQLAADIARLKTLIASIELEPSQIANGAVELLNEVSASKITGEEDRYSGSDLSDVAGNVLGAKTAFESLKPLLATDQGALVADLERRFSDVSTALDHHKGPGATGNGYVLHSALTADDTKALSTLVDALAEPLSKVAAQVLQ